MIIGSSSENDARDWAKTRIERLLAANSSGRNVHMRRDGQTFALTKERVVRGNKRKHVSCKLDSNTITVRSIRFPKRKSRRGNPEEKMDVSNRYGCALSNGDAASWLDVSTTPEPAAQEKSLKGWSGALLCCQPTWDVVPHSPLWEAGVSMIEDIGKHVLCFCSEQRRGRWPARTDDETSWP